MANCVLLALNDVPLRWELSQRLALAGIPARTANSAREAIQLTASDHPRVVVLDLGFPDLRSEDVVLLLRQLHPGLRIIGTAMQPDPAHARVVEQGLFYYAVPPTAETLHMAVVAALQKVAS